MTVDYEEQRLVGRVMRVYRTTLCVDDLSTFSRTLGVSKGLISDCERGNKRASTSLLLKYEQALKVKPGAIARAVQEARLGLSPQPKADVSFDDGGGEINWPVQSLASVVIELDVGEEKKRAPLAIRVHISAKPSDGFVWSGTIQNPRGPDDPIVGAIGFLGGPWANAKFKAFGPDETVTRVLNERRLFNRRSRRYEPAKYQILNVIQHPRDDARLSIVVGATVKWWPYLFVYSPSPTRITRLEFQLFKDGQPALQKFHAQLVRAPISHILTSIQVGFFRTNFMHKADSQLHLNGPDALVIEDLDRETIYGLRFFLRHDDDYS